MSSNDILFTQKFEDYIHDFVRTVNTDTTIAALSPIIEILKQSEILAYLLKDPSNDSARVCVRNYMITKTHLPQDFLYKFIAIAGMKISLMPTNVGFIHQSYNAKVIINNIEPTIPITNITKTARENQLRNETRNAITYEKSTRLPPQSLRLKFTDDLLPRCINAMGDLNQTIIEGNRSNGYNMSSYIKYKFK